MKCVDCKERDSRIIARGQALCWECFDKTAAARRFEEAQELGPDPEEFYI